MPAIKVKKGGVYTDPVGIFAKKAGVYSAVTGVSAKVAGAYVNASYPPAGALLNFKLSNTVNMRAMRAGGVRGRFIALGDSFLQGYGSGGNGLVGTRPNGPMAKLAARLSSLGLPARNDYMQGWPSADTVVSNPTLVTPANISLIDPRVTIVGSSIFSDFFALGGWPIAFTTAGDQITFTPGTQFDTIDLLYAVSPGQGNFLVSVDGGATLAGGTINDFNASNDIAKSSVSCPLASSVTLKKGSASSYIIGVSTRRAAVPDVQVICASITGTLLQQTATAPDASLFNNFNARKCLPVLADSSARNVILINGWFNDQQSGRTLGQIQADLATVIAFCKALPQTDVMFIDYTTADPALLAPATAATFRAGVLATCLAQDIPFLDLSKVLPNYADSVARGLMSDAAHLSGAGQAYTAQLIQTAIQLPISA